MPCFFLSCLPICSKFREDSSLPYLELKLNELQDVVEQLQRTPSGLDETLIKTIPFGVAFHHAGLIYPNKFVLFIICINLMFGDLQPFRTAG